VKAKAPMSEANASPARVARRFMCFPLMKFDGCNCRSLDRFGEKRGLVLLL